ncbi:Luciferase-like monooxygenase [Actinomadura rubteroloni]|uniref:Luciferase-like monooxygenase n=1 Tax=Actinomadura rubteroloni TaxID=1926885 RepID=A0A2P4UQR2_9ACTN|nr:LLM class F420-dependent oxidoreductase [Actinomadura rubteroloni]POM27379.1 Luciferase-like monooxygenase [Actinomadura rubteroloni]
MTDIDVGRFGIWRSWQQTSPEFAREAEALGYGTIWLGFSPGADLGGAERLLAATDRIVIATGIVNMWATAADDVAAAYRRITEAQPGRFLLGVGIGHPEATREYQSPYDTIVSYLDRLDAGGVPVRGRVLAALGPKVLRLAAERTRGAHPYLVTPEHSRRAREILGPDALLAPEQKVVVDEDAARARATARAKIADPYLKLGNYTNNLRRLGWTDADIADDGSDALIDELAPHGDAATVAAAVTRHLDAGANHVALQPLTTNDTDPLPALRALAQALDLP